MVFSSALTRLSRGLADRNLKPRTSTSSFSLKGYSRRGLPLSRNSLQLLQQVELLLQLLGLHFADVQGQLLQPLFDGQEIGGFQLILHGGHVAGRVDAALGMDDLFVAEAPHQVHQAVGAAQQVDEGRVFHLAQGDGAGVQEFDLGVHGRRLEKIGQLLQARVGDVDDGLVELVAGRGILGDLFLFLGEQVEEQGLAGLGIAEYG